MLAESRRGLPGTRLGTKQSDESKLKVSTSLKKRYEQDPTFRQKISETSTGRSKSDTERKTISDRMKRRTISAETRKRMSQAAHNRVIKKSPSKWEIDLKNYLLSAGLIENVDFIHQYQFREGSHPYDFFFPKSNIMLELDGCRVHGCTCRTEHIPGVKRMMANDARNNATVKLLGIQMIRIWYHDRDKLFEIVKSALGINYDS
jgi:hypothetical protein